MGIEELELAIRNAATADEVADVYRKACDSCKQRRFRPSALRSLEQAASENQNLKDSEREALKARLPLMNFADNCGTTCYKGEVYTLVQPAYVDGIPGSDIPYFAAIAIRDSEVLAEGQDLTKLTAYRMTWVVPSDVEDPWSASEPMKSTDDSGCDWEEPDDADPYGKYNLLKRRWS